MPAGGRSALGNFFFLAGGEGANKIARFGAAVLFAHALSPAAFGDLNVAIALSGVLLMTVNFGLSDLGARDVAYEPEHANVVAGRVLGLRLAALVVVGAPALALMLGIWSGRAGLALLAYAMAAVMAVSADWISRGLGAMQRVAVATGIGGAAVAAGAAVLLVVGGPVTAAMAVFLGGELITTCILWATAGIGRPHVTLKGVRALIRRASPVAISSLVIYAYTANVDTVIIEAVRTPREAGLYSGAYRMVLALNAVGTLSAYALLPGMARRARGPRAAEGVHESVLRAAAPLALLGVGMIAVTVGAGGPILGFIFGHEFKTVGTTFALLVVGLAWYITSFPAGYALLAIGENRAYMRGALAAGVAGLGLDLALIPPFGIVGAGVASAIAFFLAAAVWTFELGSRSGIAPRRYVPSLGAVLLATGLAIPALAIDEIRVPAAVAVGAIACAVSLRALPMLRDAMLRAPR
jgi:O-antigen/teichoic acid export membrane protein